ncbi:unnamed protein product [Chironomus riparius]|uniref:Uncharacterized protein n=1 Tax=Chironomus riparius TaxID=315576 RepID=A0A9N9S889_9DIPT|nr:unnamed protein product [Chironomus riparius]
MAKIFTVLVVFGLIACCTAATMSKRDVSELLRHHVNEHVHYGNGIPGDQAEIEHEHFNIDKVGNYDFGYKQTDLQEREETGSVKRNSVTGKRQLNVVTGSYKYLRPDGFWQIVTYRADKNGFVPSITVTRNEISNDLPELSGLVPAIPILSSTEGSSSTTTAATGSS